MTSARRKSQPQGWLFCAWMTGAAVKPGRRSGRKVMNPATAAAAAIVASVLCVALPGPDKPQSDAEKKSPQFHD
jgi:hypothetical protein